MMPTSLVSVIIPTYKRPNKLKRAMNSVFKQSYKNWQLIIVDDNDQESQYRKETEEFMTAYINHDRVVYLKHLSNKGGSAARNTGIKKSAGKFIAFLDDDDQWSSTKLEKMLKEFDNHGEDYGVCFSNYYIVSTTGRFLELKPKASGDIFKKQLLRDHVSPTSAVIVKRECFEKIGFFDEKLPARQDYDMWLRISKNYKFIYLNEPLMYMYRKDSSISSNYKNCLNGTILVLEKIKNELVNYDKNFRKRVYASQYRYLGRVCNAHNQYKRGRKYFLKSLKFSFDIKTLFLLILTYMGPHVWEFGGKVKNSFLKLLK